MKLIEPDLLWRLGSTESAWAKALTRYFARRLHQPAIARRLSDQLALEYTTSSCVVLTSSALPLPAGSALTGLEVRSLAMMGRVSQSIFTFFDHRQPISGPQILAEAAPGTTLRYVRTDAKAFVDNVAYPLDPRQKAILLALIDDRDHEMDKDSLKRACGSEAQRFTPSKVFERIPKVYQTFFRYQPMDDRYLLIIPEEDRAWLR